MTHSTFQGDPYKSIASALLNSADIRAYSEYGPSGTRLFEPFDAVRLKSASYAVRFDGADYYYWAPHSSKRVEGKIAPNSCLTIPSNGIVFVSPIVEFNVPDYLALRFNLAIRWVHRGLLLGTGPLVDPGFKGRLLIPVHNLTDSPVDLPADKDFIWIEVTKISLFPPTANAHGSLYVPFDPKKKDLDVGQYFDKANKGAPIRSSIPSIAEEARNSAAALHSEWSGFQSEIRSTVQRSESNIRQIQILGAIALIVTVAGMFFGVYQIVESTKALVLAAQQSIDGASSKVGDQLHKLSSRLDAIEAKAPIASASQPAAKRDRPSPPK